MHKPNELLNGKTSERIQGAGCKVLFLPDLKLSHDIYGFICFETDRKYCQDPDLLINTKSVIC